MRIRSSVKLTAWVTISLILIYSAFTVIFSWTIEAKFRDLRTSSNIRTLFAQLQDTTSDYFLFPTERAYQQWRILHSELFRIMNSQDYRVFQAKYHTEDLEDEMQSMGEAFSKLVFVSRKVRLSPEEAGMEFRNRLITQITLTARGIGASLDNISTKIEGRVLSLQRTSTLMDIIALFLVAASLVLIASFFSRSVVQPILKLHEGADIIGRGDLDFRVEPTGPGEIRELSQSFNQMTANLSDLQASLRKSQEDLRYLASQLIVSQEKERQDIGLELHEDLGQLLALLKMQLRTLQRNLPTESVEIKADLENSLDLFNDIVERIRRLSMNLRPSVLEDMGLSTGLKLLFEDFQKYHDLELSVDMDDVEKTFPWEQRILIYRICQEFLTNAVKHSGGTGVTISIKKKDGNICFRMEDNGKGFDLQEVLARSTSSRGLGLAAIDERLRMLGGESELWSQPGHGTRLHFTIPVDISKGA